MESLVSVEFDSEPITISTEKNSDKITPEHLAWLKNLKKRTIICVCSEGINRSVFAVDYLKSLDFNCRLLPGGLESFKPYLFGDTNLYDPKMERRFNRNPEERKSIGEYRTDYNSIYNNILGLKNALWLVFIGGKMELLHQRKTIQHLRKAYGLEVILLETIQPESVKNNIQKLLEGKIVPSILQTHK